MEASKVPSFDQGCGPEAQRRAERGARGRYWAWGRPGSEALGASVLGLGSSSGARSHPGPSASKSCQSDKVLWDSRGAGRAGGGRGARGPLLWARHLW